MCRTGALDRLRRGRKGYLWKLVGLMDGWLVDEWDEDENKKERKTRGRDEVDRCRSGRGA